MAKSTLNSRIATALKSYRNNGSKLLDLMVEAVDHAEQHSHNITPMKNIVGGLRPKDRKDALTIFGAFAPIVIKDDEISLVKNNKKREYTIDRKQVEAAANFSELAVNIRAAKGETEVEPKVYNALAGVERLYKKFTDEGVSVAYANKLAALIKEMEAAQETVTSTDDTNVVDMQTEAA